MILFCNLSASAQDTVKVSDIKLDTLDDTQSNLGKYLFSVIKSTVDEIVSPLGTATEPAIPPSNDLAAYFEYAFKQAAKEASSSVGKSMFNETKIFYKPSPVFEDMSDLVFNEYSIKMEDTVKIYTYSFRCKNPKADIFLVHGNGGNVSTYKNAIKALLSGNYNVYVVDWRGYGKSNGTPEYKGVIKDTEAAFAHFLSQNRKNSLKVIVYGMSLGGQMATKLTSDRQKDIDALILDGSLSSAENLARDYVPVKSVRNIMSKNAAAFNRDYIAEEDIKKIKIPKLIIHSEIDRTVMFYHGYRLYTNAPEPKVFWTTQTSHIGTLEELPNEALDKIGQLIDSIQ